MESRLPRFCLMDHRLKDNLLSPIPSRPQFESYNRQLLLRDSSLPVAEFSKRQDVAKKLNHKSHERGDSKIPVSKTLTKSSSLQDGGQRIQIREQQTAHEIRQDQINSVELESVTQPKPTAILTFGHSSSGRRGRGSTEGTLKAVEKEHDETETQTAEWLGKNEMLAGSRVLELKRKFEAFGAEQGKRKLERQNIRKRDIQNDELYQQKTDLTVPTLDIGKRNEPLTNEIASALQKPDIATFLHPQQLISSNSYRRWTSTYPRSTLSLSTQQPSTGKHKNSRVCQYSKPRKLLEAPDKYQTDGESC